MESVSKIKSRIGNKFDLLDWQLGLMEYLMLPKALRPHRNFLMAKFGIAESTYYYCLRSQKFNAARREFTKQFYKDDIPDVLMAMKDEAISGNPVAAKLFLEYVDDWNRDPRSIDPEAPTTINVNETKTIVYNLQQKFYGKAEAQIEAPKVIEAEE